jgi:succinyl-diaminopimelate desuccinylase
MIKTKIDEYINQNKDNMIRDLSRLIAFRSVKSAAEPNAPFGKECAAVLADALSMCSDYGFITRNIDNYVGTVDFYEGESEYGILSHLDVVPEGTGWTSDPYKAELRDGKIFGRGSIDDKGPTIAALYALRAFKELNIPLSKNIRLILGTDEECGSGDLEYYTKIESLPKNLFTPDGSFPVINIEKGRCAVEIGKSFESSSQVVKASGGVVVNAVAEEASATVSGISKDIVLKAIDEINLPIDFSVEESGGEVNIFAKGKSAHASTPELGKNATVAIITLLSKLPIVNKEYKDALCAIAKLFPFGQTDGTAAGLNLKDEKSGGLTLVLSLLKADEKSISATMDIRFPVCASVAEVRGILESKLKAENLEILSFTGVEPHSVDENSEFVQTLLSAYENVTGNPGQCLAIGGGTYVHETEGGVAFGAEFPGKDNHMHGVDEFIEVDDLLLTAKIYANAIYELCK